MTYMKVNLARWILGGEPDFSGGNPRPASQFFFKKAAEGGAQFFFKKAAETPLQASVSGPARPRRAPARLRPGMVPARRQSAPLSGSATCAKGHGPSNRRALERGALAIGWKAGRAARRLASRIGLGLIGTPAWRGGASGGAIPRGASGKRQNAKRLGPDRHRAEAGIGRAQGERRERHATAAKRMASA